MYMINVRQMNRYICNNEILLKIEIILLLNVDKLL